MTRPMSARTLRALSEGSGICTVCGCSTLRGTICEPCKERAQEAKARAAAKEKAESDTVSDEDWQAVARLVNQVKRHNRRKR